MTMKKAGPEDPMGLVGVRLPAGNDEKGAVRDMVECLVEEYLFMGFTPEKVLGLFKDPFYRGAHEAYRRLGEARILEVIKRNCRILRPDDVD